MRFICCYLTKKRFSVSADDRRCHPTQPFRCPGDPNELKCISIQYLCGKKSSNTELFIHRCNVDISSHSRGKYVCVLI